MFGVRRPGGLAVRVVVRREASAVSCFFGLDVSTHRVSLGVVRGDELAWRTCSLDRADSGVRRLAGAHRDLWPFLSGAVREYRPVQVGVEQPMGAKMAMVHPQSMYMVGIVLAVLGGVLEPSVPVVMLPPPRWKRFAVGHGAADKERVRLWARRSGYTGLLQDEADALGVAVAVQALSGSGALLAAQTTLPVE